MPIYRVTVTRKQVWHFDDVEAEDKEAARDKADHMACHEEAHDDYAYSTEAEEVHDA